MELNKYQSTPEELNLELYPSEIKEDFYSFTTNVPYIKNLISANRPKASDCPRDEQGRIIVDLTNPPIIEDTDYFRPTAIYFQQHGVITNLRPNPNPNSEYGKWVREEIRRCFLGYTRPSDGAWVTGDMYFFLNYCPIIKVKKIKGKKGIRVVDFPDFLEGQWLKFMYIHKAREAGKHGSELAARGRGKAHPYDEIIYTPKGLKRWEDIKVGDYVFGDDGKLTKVTNIPFDGIAPIYEIILSSGYKVKCSEGHLWQVYSHNKGNITVSTKLLLSLYKRPRKISKHNPKGYELDCTIPVGNGAEFPYLKTLIDPYTFGLLLGDGCFRNKGYKNTVNLTAEDDDFKVYSDYIPYKHHIIPSGKYLHSIEIPNISNILNDYGLYYTKSENKFIPNEYKYNTKEVRLAILKGILDADGTVTNGKIELVLTSKLLIQDIQWLCASLGIATINNKPKKGWYYNKDRLRVDCLAAYRLSIFSNIPVFNLPRKLQLWENRSKTAYAQSKYKGYKIVDITYLGEQKCKCITVDNESHCYLINNFIVTHNSFTMAAIMAKRFILGEYNELENKITSRVETFCASYLKNYLNEDGVLNKFESYIDFCSEYTQFPKKRLISSMNNMHWLMGYKDNNSEAKKGSLNEVIGISVKDSEGKLRGKRGAFIGLEEFGSFPNLIGLYGTLRPSMEDGDIVFGMIYCQGTAGDKESDFKAALQIMYAPRAFNMYPIKNVYDKVGQGKPEFVYFYPAYVNRNGCYSKDGISDVTKAILEVLVNRYNVKYNTTNMSLITKTIAEHPITPQEAIMKTLGNLFPTQLLNERINQIDSNPNEFDDVLVGTLILLKNGKVEFKPTLDTPIREFPTDDNKEKGAIEFFSMPEIDRDGNVYRDRYIIGHDPVDDDLSNTMSLTSTFVLDLFTDRIVAEYTGRQAYADDNFEIVRKLCLFYNARCIYEAHPYSQIVYTPQGMKKWGDIKIGDTLFSPTKGTTKVIDIPIDNIMDIYKVVLNDGRVIYASDNHIWNVYKGTSKSTINITTKQLLEEGLLNKHGLHKYFIPEHLGVEYPIRDLSIDSYTMGLILAEGSITGSHCTKNYIQISSSKEDMLEYKHKIPYDIKYIGTKGYSWHMHISGCKSIMRQYGLLGCTSHTKFIPKDYLFSSKLLRLELLKGLMDGDGCAISNSASIFITCSKLLAEDIILLCRSLGIKAWKAVNKNEVYRVSIATDIKIFNLKRKIEKQHKYQPYTRGSKASSLLYKTAIVDIQYSHQENGKCVTVDSDDGLYLIGDYVTTHNCNKKGIFAYFSKMNCIYLLAETPLYLKDQLVIKEIGYGNKARGINATHAVNVYADLLTREWLIKPIVVPSKDGEEEVTIPNLMFVKNRAFLQELASYNPNGNFDRIRAFGMVMLYRLEKIIMYQGDMKRIVDHTDVNNPANDEFFTLNYDNRF